jgi:hypothetical protein
MGRATLDPHYREEAAKEDASSPPAEAVKSGKVEAKVPGDKGGCGSVLTSFLRQLGVLAGGSNQKG